MALLSTLQASSPDKWRNIDEFSRSLAMSAKPPKGGQSELGTGSPYHVASAAVFRSLTAKPQTRLENTGLAGPQRRVSHL